MTDKFANEKLFPCSNKSDLHTHTLSIISIKYQDKMKILFIIIIIIQFKSLKFSSCVCVYVINNKWWCHKQRHQTKQKNKLDICLFLCLFDRCQSQQINTGANIQTKKKIDTES